MRQVPAVVSFVASLWAGEALASTALPVLSISDQLVLESAGQAEFEVTLSAPLGVLQQVTVQWFAENLTAHAPDDYVAASGTLEFTSAGRAFVRVDLVDDSQPGEGSEVFLVRLAWPTNAMLGKGVGQGVIQDDDDAAVPRAKCDLDHDGRSNLLVLHPPAAGIPEPPLRHRPLHQDWPLNGPLAVVGPESVEYDGTEHQEHWALIAMDDFDGNGTCDLFWEHEDEQVAVTLTKANGPLQAPHPEDILSIPHPGPGWRLVGSGPFDGDMRADLVFWDPVGRVLQAWLWVPGVPGQMPAVTVHELPLSLGPSEEPLAVLDLYDGPSTGIVWRDTVSGALSYSRLNGLELLEWRSIRYPSGTRIDQSWRVAAVGDFDGDGDGDGDEDIVWQKTPPGPGGKVAVWLMTGTTHVRETSASPELLKLEPPLQVLEGIIDGPR